MRTTLAVCDVRILYASEASVAVHNTYASRQLTFPLRFNTSNGREGF